MVPLLLEPPVDVSTPPAPLSRAFPRHTSRHFREHRHRERAPVDPMYSRATVRVHAQGGRPLEGHIHNLSVAGALIELDFIIAVDEPVTIDLCIAGLGAIHNGQWPDLATAARVVRYEELDEFPGGPYKTAVQFLQTSTMVRLAIARYVSARKRPASLLRMYTSKCVNVSAPLEPVSGLETPGPHPRA